LAIKGEKVLMNEGWSAGDCDVLLHSVGGTFEAQHLAGGAFRPARLIGRDASVDLGVEDHALGTDLQVGVA